MKNLLILLTAISASAAQVEQPKEIITQIIEPQFIKERNGKEKIHSIRTSYETGAYDSFLEESDLYYKDISETRSLDQLVNMRPGFSSVWQDWEDKALTISKEKNRALKEVVDGEEKSPFIEKVLFVSDELSDEAHQNAIKRIAHFRMMKPGSGENDDENRLIDIDLEYEFKALHLDLPGSFISEKQEKHCVLRMQQLDKMREAAAHFQNEDLKEAVALYAEHFDARLAQNWDLADLNQLVNGKEKPANAVEEKVVVILNEYIEKLSNLSRQFLAEIDPGMEGEEKNI